MNKKKLTTIVGGALAGVILLGVTAQAAPSLTVSPGTETFYVDGQEVELEAYAINGNNYVKLRDVGKLGDFGVTYDQSGKNVTIDFDAPYIPEAPAQTPKEYNDVPYKTVSLAESDPNYYKDLWAAEVYNFKMIRSLPTLFEFNSWDTYRGTANNLSSYDVNALTDTQKAAILKAKEAREAMNKQQLIPFDQEVLYIWEDGKMPILTEDVESKFTVDSWDNSDFKPFLIPYLLADQSKAKGTMIILSGGGNSTRSNEGEGYKVCPAFNKVGYNCFLLQRRVEPYSNDEIVMDLQRAIRYVKYHAEEWKLGGMDVLGAAGFSGGAGNLCTLMERFYGNITPDKYVKDYKPDAIDAVNSDLDIAIPIYSGHKLTTDNPNVPHIFTAVGEDDGIDGGHGYEVIGQGAIDLYIQMKSEERFKDVSPELHIYGQNGHGFGPGLEGTSSMLWIPSADLYMQKVMGKAEQAYTGEVPAEYTRMQTVVFGGFHVGDTTITVYINNANDKFYMAFVAFGEDQIVEGVLINDRVASVTYDKSGYFAGDAAAIYELCDPSAWTPVQ